MADKEGRGSGGIVMKARGIRKVYPGTVALKNVDFNVYEGKVNVLVGENGAGKSTLMKILAGTETPTKGRILLRDEQITLSGPRSAAEYGVGMIHQELNLFPNLSVAENIFANRELTRRGIIDHEKQNDIARSLIQHLKQKFSPTEKVSNLKVGEQQIVEIAKALNENASVLIMDEPTSALSATEVDVLFDVVADLKSQGVSIIYISHRLDELVRIGDVITVLRDGKLIDERPMAEIDVPWIVRSMVGGKADEIFHSGERKIGEVILEVENLSLPREGQGHLPDGISFRVRSGEVLGLYGLMGAGRSETVESIMGMNEASTGTITLEGESIEAQNILNRIKKGIALVPEDRQREGIVTGMSVDDNLVMSSLWRLLKAGFHIDGKKRRGQVARLIEELHIKTPSPASLVSSLSGGNQQKVVIGKSLLTEPKVLLMDEPTRGIDVGAKAEVFNIINDLASRGLGIIFVTSEIKEILAIADRVLVLSRGKITGEFNKKTATEEDLIQASAIGHITTD